MRLVAHPDRNNVWVRPELIRQRWVRDEPDVGFPVIGFLWNGADGTGDQDGDHGFEANVVSVGDDTRSTRIRVGSSIGS